MHVDICVVYYERSFLPVKPKLPVLLEAHMLRTDAVLPLVLFTLLTLMLGLHGLSASGHFPRRHRAAALRSLLGVVILHSTILIALTALIAGLWVPGGSSPGTRRSSLAALGRP